MLFIFILITGRIKGVVSFLKKDIHSLCYIHCVAHKEHLNSLNIIIKTINTIKRNSILDRIFNSYVQIMAKTIQEYYYIQKLDGYLKANVLLDSMNCTIIYLNT